MSWIGMSRFTPKARLAAWIGLIVLAVIPWTDLQDHSHWARVRWVPFASPPIRIFDIVGNGLLYVPFGYLLFQVSAGRGRRWRVVAFAAALSIGTEWTQLYSHSRFPSLTDVTCNVLGACCGAWLAHRVNRESG
jgi:glycopeptide antibiotics resistance protein